MLMSVVLITEHRPGELVKRFAEVAKKSCSAIRTLLSMNGLEMGQWAI